MRKWLHRALKGASLTTALFVFQACYGTPPGPYEELEAVDETELVEVEEAVPEAPAQTLEAEAEAEAAAE